MQNMQTHNLSSRGMRYYGSSSVYLYIERKGSVNLLYIDRVLEFDCALQLLPAFCNEMFVRFVTFSVEKQIGPLYRFE